MGVLDNLMASVKGSPGNPPVLSKGLLTFGAVCFFCMIGDSRGTAGLKRQGWLMVVPCLVLLVAYGWLSVVTGFVPEPYLDEIFHIPQAQTYCEGQYYDWDDKITTPPGLYIITLLHNSLFGPIPICTPLYLRTFNIHAIALLALLVQECKIQLQTQTQQGSSGTTSIFNAAHTALNAALFPVLFFFSGLYYTDIPSALAVLVIYRVHLGRVTACQNSRQGQDGNGRGGGGGFMAMVRRLGSDLLVLLFGIVSLGMRQTNVFWVVVFMGGLEVVAVLKGLRERGTSEERRKGNEAERFKTMGDVVGYYWNRWAKGDIHDPELDQTWPDDVIISLVSLAIAGLNHPITVLRQVWPYLAVLGSFCGFVVWNGGVVLGDKSNHVATIHLTQMLYIWPMFLFFSFPLSIPFILDKLATFTPLLRPFFPPPSPPSASSSPAKPTPPKQEVTNPTSKLLDTLKTTRFAIYTVFLPAALAGILAIIHFNTIIHPFTLADNRHYMFYIFRYTIRRSPLVRYGLAFAYWVAGYLAYGCLAGSGRLSCVTRRGEGFSSSPFTTRTPPESETSSTDEDEDNGDNGRADRAMNKEGITTTASKEATPAGLDTTPPPTSTALIWLLTTALSLITAPLVEPRYFILPWLFWRIHLPAWSPAPSPSPSPSSSPSSHNSNRLVVLARTVDVRMFVETAWFIVINVATMYIFITKPFLWFDGEGNVVVDRIGGRWQRFMW